MRSSLKLRIFRNTGGYPDAEAAPGFELVSQLLVQDVQSSTITCRMILSALDDVLAGRRDSWEMTFNADTLLLFPDIARIESEVSEADESCEVSLTELQNALLQWCDLLETETRNGSPQ